MSLLRTRLLAAVLLPMLAACSALESASNPLIGRWTAEEPTGTFSLGTYEFRAGRMDAMGFQQEVDYRVSGNVVRIVPRGFGPQLEATILDRDTAEIGSPLTGGLVILHRLR